MLMAKQTYMARRSRSKTPLAQFTPSASRDLAVHRIGHDEKTGEYRVSVYMRYLSRGPVYYARIKVSKRELANGQRYLTVSLKTSNLDEALDRARQKLAETVFAEQRQVAIKPLTTAQAIDKFIKHYEEGVQANARGYSGDMLRGFRKSIALYWTVYVGHKSLNSITVNDLADYERWRLAYANDPNRRRHGNAKTTASPRTLQWEINAFKQMLRWCAQRDLYAGRAYEWAYKVGPKKRRSALTLDQYRKLYRYMRSSAFMQVGKHGSDVNFERHRQLLRTYILFMANTGLRVGEARYLKWADIVPINNRIGQTVPTVRISAEYAKNRKERTAIGRHTALLALNRWRQYLQQCNEHVTDQTFVFSRPDGSSYFDMREGVKTVFDEAGVASDTDGMDLTPYSLRHTYISFRIRFAKNLEIFKLAANCGTSVAMIEKHYGHVRNQDFVDELSL